MCEYSSYLHASMTHAYLQAVAPLHKLAKDAVVRSRKESSEEICCLNIPRTLQKQLIVLSRDYQEMERSKVEPCLRCKEIHQ